MARRHTGRAGRGPRARRCGCRDGSRRPASTTRSGSTARSSTSLSPASDRYQGATRAPGGGTYNVGYTTVAGHRPRVRLDAGRRGRPARSRLRRQRRGDRERRDRPFAAPPGRHHADRRRRDRARRRRPGRRQDRRLRPGRDPAGRGQARQPRHRHLRRALRHRRRRPTPPSAPAASSASTSPTAVGAGNTDQRRPVLRPRDPADGKLARRSAPRASTRRAGAHRPRHRGRAARDRRRPGPDLRHRRRRDHAQRRASARTRATACSGRRQGHRDRLRHRDRRPVRPFIYRFNANGTPDATFGTGGIATDEVGGPAPGLRRGLRPRPAGRQVRLRRLRRRSTTPANGIDVVVYRFNANGTWDRRSATTACSRTTASTAPTAAAT